MAVLFVMILLEMAFSGVRIIEGSDLHNWVASIFLMGVFLVGYILFLPTLHQVGALEREMMIDRGIDHHTLAQTLERVLARDGSCEVREIGPYRTQEQDGMYSTNPRPTVHYAVSKVDSEEVMLELWFYIEEGRVDLLVPRAYVDLIPRFEGVLMNLG
jgi:hypothetical protein